MKRVLQLSCLLILAGAAFLVWQHLFPSPERQIRKRMVALQELVSFDSSDGNFAALAAREKLGGLFAADARVRVEVRGGPHVTLVSRDEIMNAALAARRQLEELDVEFLDVVVTLAADEGSAVVEVTGKARPTSDSGLWVQVLRFKFLKTEDGWLISQVETVPLFTHRHVFRAQTAQAAASA